MLKEIIAQPHALVAAAESWLNVETLARVEVTSEQPEHPVEAALVVGDTRGWRAALPGEQLLRLVFVTPQNLSRIHLLFVETETSRVQEFVLRWLPRSQTSYREILRQQFVFSPPATTRQFEDYRVTLDDALALELIIRPDISGGPSLASLNTLRLA